jgi:uncharacterized membrane protein
MAIKVLLVGESWVTSSTHLKGFDFFVSTHYATGGDFLIDALTSGGIEAVHQPSHEAARAFPLELSNLEQYDVVILSDIGANTLLLPPEVFLEGKRVPNRLELIKQYVRNGGGLVMAGGYLSFQGIYGSARYHRTPIEEVLPVTLLPVDDRVETGRDKSRCKKCGAHDPDRDKRGMALSARVQRADTKGSRRGLSDGG